MVWTFNEKYPFLFLKYSALSPPIKTFLFIYYLLFLIFIFYFYLFIHLYLNTYIHSVPHYFNLLITYSVIRAKYQLIYNTQNIL